MLWSISRLGGRNSGVVRAGDIAWVLDDFDEQGQMYVAAFKM